LIDPLALREDLGRDGRGGRAGPEYETMTCLLFPSSARN
jgi:hypothetical protein